MTRDRTALHWSNCNNNDLIAKWFQETWTLCSAEGRGVEGANLHGHLQLSGHVMYMPSLYMYMYMYM